MKKIISIILAMVIIVMSTITTLAATTSCNCGNDPIIFVHGFGSSLYLNGEDGETECVYPTQTNSIINATPQLIASIGSLAILRNNEKFVECISSAINEIMGKLACDKNGDSIYDIFPEPSLPVSADVHLNELNKTDEDIDLVDGKYVFYYDWRLDPFENAKYLNEFIEHIKELTNHKKVILTCHSQGNTIVATYLHTYGCQDLKKVVFLSSAYKGISLIGSVFTGNISLGGKEYAIELFLKGLIGSESYGQLVTDLLSVSNEIGITTPIFDLLQSILDENLDAIYEECLIEIFATMPGIWSFVPDEYYQEAKTKMFGDGTGYETLIERIDKYHYSVQNNVEKIIEATENNGVKIAIALGYDISSIPVTDGEAVQSDMLIDSKYMSLGATFSKVDSSFEENYEQAQNKCLHNHISPDKKVDASTCAFPEYTWFVKGLAHNDFPNGYVNFFNWLIRYDGQPTVHSNEKYSQFMTIDEQGKIIPLTESSSQEPEEPQPEIPEEPEDPQPEIPEEPEEPQPEIPEKPEEPQPEIPEKPEEPQPEIPNTDVADNLTMWFVALFVCCGTLSVFFIGKKEKNHKINLN